MLFTYRKIALTSLPVRFSSAFSPKFLLSPENRERSMRTFQRMLIKQGAKEPKRKAAVLIPLYIKNDEISLLYTLRSANLKAHRGQVSFPGGMQDEKDESLKDTALRETEEELGLKKEDIEIWGNGNSIIRQDLAILPIVGCITANLDLDTLTLNPNEVEALFTVSLRNLCKPANNKHTQFRGTYSTPTYIGGPYRIWGLTAIMTFMFLKSFLPAKAYNHQVKYIPDVISILHKPKA